MSKAKRHRGIDPRGTRRWCFADCIFDEADWTLTVAGKRVPIESKPLELLRLLLLNAEHLVSKDELMDAAWPNVAVVEASLPTAMRKLRLALGDDGRAQQLIETVPRIGYRLLIPATVEHHLVGAFASSAAPRPHRAAQFARPLRQSLLIAGGVLGSLVLATAMIGPAQPVAASKANRTYSDRDAMIALRRLDVAKVDTMLAADWKPDKLDADGNNALNRLLEICEWDPAHDRRRMMVIARALLDGGAAYSQHNKWGDTAYSIAKAKRYCGPDHPVTIMLRNLCYAKGKASGDRCLATYELEQRPAARS